MTHKTVDFIATYLYIDIYKGLTLTKGYCKLDMAPQ